MGFGEGELFRYDFLHDLFISSNSKQYNILKNTKTAKINDVCGFTYEKYDNKVYGALMHEYGHYVNLGSAGYIDENWLIKNYEQISKYISIYAGEKRIEFLAEVFALKNIPNYNELDKETKQFIISNYDNKIPVKNNFIQGGLIAPNGKPSGLYFTEIYNLVRGKEFKNWFGDWEEAYKTKDYEGVSKIINENGEPLICVHNTRNEFYEFDEFEIGKNTDAGYYGKGFYFTPNVGQPNYGEIELNCFLSIKNPYYKQESYRNYELNSDDLKNQGFDGVVVYPTYIEEFNFENGVDGCQEVVAYSSEQIKLGDGRNTTFDNYNPDIRYNDGGEAKKITKKEKQEIISSTNKVVGLMTYKLSSDGNWVMRLDSRTNKYKSHQRFDLFYDNILEREREKYARENAHKVFEHLDNSGAELLNKSLGGSRYYIYNGKYIRVSNHHNQTQQTDKETGINKYKHNEHNFYSYEKDGWKEMISKIESLSNPDIRFEDGGSVIINPTEIECHNCHWKWKVKDGGDDLFICHKCYTDNTKFYKFEGLKGEKILDTITYAKGGQLLNLNQIRKGQYEAKSDEIEIYLTNPKILNGIGTNKWQLIVMYRNDDVINEWFETKNEALKTGVYLLNDFFNNNFKKGGRTIAQTPAPKKDQIKGSDKNKEGSAKDISSAKKIKFSDDVLEKIQNSVDKHNKKHPNKKITIDSAKAVVRRGMGAYSSTHRPTISGGNENSRVAWGLARLNAFLYKIVNGKSKSGKYSQDNDLIEELGYKVQKYEIGGIFQGTPYDFAKYSTEYIGTGEGNQVFGWGLYFTDLKDVAKYYMSAGIDDEEAIKLDGKSLSEYNVEQEVKDQLVGIINIIFGEDKLIPTIELIKDDLILEYDEENYPEFKSVVEESTKTWNLIKDKKLSFSGNIYSVTLFKGENPYEYDLLEWEQKPTEIQILKIKNQAKKEGVNLSKLPFDLERYRDSNAIYTDLSYIISGVSHLNNRDSGKMCSKFLLRAGIDGIKYKAGTLSGFEDEEGYNYVIFDADDVTIENKEKYADGGELENEELNKIKEAYDFGSEYFDGKIYGQEYKIRMNKNHPRNSNRNDDQSIHNLSLVNVEYPSAVVFREKYDKLQYQYDKIFYWEDAKEKIEDFFYEIKDRAEDYSNGGDIQAYEEAMGISEFKEGGEAKPKKVYVSIILDNEIEGNFPDYFWKYDEKTFEELKSGVLKGLVGVSSSPNNIAEWFVLRDCLIVMDYEDFISINETETIDYYDSYQLMKNNLYLFRRLYANVRRKGEQKDAILGTLKKILEKIVPEINLEMNLAEGQKYSELYRISRFLSPYETSAFPNWIENNRINIESPVDLTDAILEFNKYYDSYLGNGYENPVLTFNELLPVVEKGISRASSIYYSEQEIVLTNRELNIPKNSQLFFVDKDEVGRVKESNKDELIQKYNLKELYKIYFVDRQQIQKYRDFWVKKEEEKFNKKLEKGREDLEFKKEQVLDELINYFLEKSISYVKNELEKEYLEYSESLEYYDETDDDSIEQNLFSIPLVESIINTYVLIVKNFWKAFIQKKKVKNLDLYAFDMFYFNVKQELKNYFENKKDELEKLNNYRNTRSGFSLNPYRFERLLLKTIDDYEKLPELIDYKELSKMYLDKMGRELYRYYDKKDLPLISQYKDGGSVLLAPNGKPSNLTPEQYMLVREPAFKKWFGDWENSPENASKIVDENGEPLVVYHGSNEIFFEFKNRLFGYRGFYFTDKKSVARSYGSNVRQFFLNSKDFVLEDMKGGSYADNEWIDDLVQNSEIDNKDVHLLNFIDPLDPSSMNRFPISNIYIIFNKSNIKLADGSNTTFDGNNPDIRFDNGGEADEPTNFWGTEAGGVLVYCSTTDRYLILLRSEWVLEPNTWGIISGKLDDDETNIEDAVLRESEEETGHKLGDLIPSFVFEKPNFKFHNFVSIIEKEFVPELNWENTDYKWVKLNEMPDNLHFGLKLLLQKEDMQKLVEKNKNNTMNKYNPKDEVTFNIPLLIRFAELMREEIKTDVALHEIIENLIDIKDKGTLTMRDYDSMVGNVTGTEENTNTDAVEEEKMAEGGKVNSIKSKKGDIMVSLDDNWYSDDSSVELVPVTELIKFREFDRKVSPKYNQDNSIENINHLKFMFQKEGVKSPLIIEYSADDSSVLIIEGNHRLNSAIDLGMEYLPARVVLKKHGKYSPAKIKNAMKVDGIKANSSNYIPSDLKPSQVGIAGAKPIAYAEGGIIEGRLHSECGDDGCGRKFQVGENGHIIEAERDEAVIVADAFTESKEMTIQGTPSEIASALNVVGGGKNFDKGAKIIEGGNEKELPEMKQEASDTDVDDVIDSGSIIINRRSMADEKSYKVTGSAKQIASAINSINGNGVVIEKGAKIE
jgi:8-oxo-dGTP pyrophosphatase MutT (NUDIX family)